MGSTRKILVRATVLINCFVVAWAGMLWVPISHGDTFVLPPEGINVVGSPRYVKARYEDTLSDIARRYGLGFQEIALANPDIDPWLPGEGTEVLLPSQYVLPDAPRDGIVLNVPEMRLYYYPKVEAGEVPIVITHPVSIGRVEWNTPLGTTKVTKKAVNPSWYPPASIRKEHEERGEILPKRVPPGPDNPLGAYAMRLGIPGYLIHGTNRPYGVGMRVTHGCVRLYPEDIKSLFDDVPIGTAVHIVNQPYKAGWRNGLLYVEAHPPLDEDVEKFARNRTPVIEAVVKVSPESNSSIDWEKVVKVSEETRGLPTQVSTEVLDVVAVLSDTQSKVQEKIKAAATELNLSQ